MKILVLTPFCESEWEWFGTEFSGEKWKIVNLCLFGKKPWTWLFAAFKSIKLYKNADILMSHHPYMTYYIALVHWLFNIQKPHYAFSFNHGNGRFLKGINLFLARKAFKFVDGFVVFSEKEKNIYENYYQIPHSKMSFIHWAVNPPEIDLEKKYINEFKPYVCCMGRNNRDFEIFIKAISELKINAIIVCPQDAIQSPIPENIIVRSGIPMKEAMKVLAESTICVTPLKDASVGAGHITIVSSLQLGIPQIITQVATVNDYFINGQHGLFIEKGSVNSLKRALNKLFYSPEKLQLISENSTQFAEKWLTERASRDFLKKYIENIKNDMRPPSVPEGWSLYKKTHNMN